MLYCDRNDVSEGMDVNKTSESCKCFICNYYYFLKVSLRFEARVCDGCMTISVKKVAFKFQ